MLEILVVVAIMALLVIIAIPVSSNIQKGAMKAKCASNMRQIGVGLFSYASDNNGMLPPVADRWGPPNSILWPQAIWEYAGYNYAAFQGKKTFDSSGKTSPNIFHCPANAKKFTGVPSLTQPVNTSYFSYGLNCGPVGDNVTGWTTPIPLSRVHNRTRTVMVTECSFALGSRWGYYYYYGLMPHESGANFLFFDGHVEWMSFDDVFKKRNNVEFWLGQQK